MWLKAWFQKASCVCGGPDLGEGHYAFAPEKDNKEVVLYPVSAKCLAAVIRFYSGHRQVAVLWHVQMSAGCVHRMDSQWVNK